MPIDAILESSESPENQRGARRLHIRIEAAGELEQGGQTSVTIHNLSASGILIETQSALEVGQKIRIELPETSPVPATVVWKSSPLFGCRFDHILSRAVLSAAQLFNPLPTGIDPIFPQLGSLDHEPLAARLFRIRRTQGISRAELAARSGLSKPSIWSYETGKAIPRHSNLILLAEALNLSATELLTGNTVSSPKLGDAETIDHHPPAPQDHKPEHSPLQQVIGLSRKNIAQIAGVEEHRVRISIDY